VKAHLTFRDDDEEAAPSNTYNDNETNLAYKDDDFKGLSDLFSVLVKERHVA